jgi:nucleotide-binding universal stress UspA family protein
VSVSAGGPVVAGVDLSEPSKRAAWAGVWEAQWRGVPLRLVYGWSQEVCLGPHTLPVEVTQAPLDEARRALEDLVGDLRREYPAVSVETALVRQPPAAALIEHSRAASAVVVGAQGQSGHHDVPVGSVVGQVAARAHCPVIVVNAGADQAASVQAAVSGPVVVGIDDAPAADVVAFALAEAAARGRELVLVHADDEPAIEEQGEEVSARLADVGVPVTEALREQVGRHPDVAVSQVTGHGDLADFLLGIAADASASLIVVGCRGHSEILNLLRRSVDRRLIGAADRPVAVVHHCQRSAASPGER